MIDFDASVSFRETQYVGAKYSSAYCPPEMLEIVYSNHGSIIRVRKYKTDDSGVLIQEDRRPGLLLAHPSYDMWSLGVTLYQVIELLILHSIA